MTHERLRAMFRAIDARDWEALGSYLHPDIVYLRPGFPVLEGREAVLRFYREVRAIQGEHQIEGLAIDGELGAHWGRFVGTKTDGTPVDLQYSDCYTFRDGLIWRRKSHFFVAQA